MDDREPATAVAAATPTPMPTAAGLAWPAAIRRDPDVLRLSDDGRFVLCKVCHVHYAVHGGKRPAPVYMKARFRTQSWRAHKRNAKPHRLLRDTADQRQGHKQQQLEKQPRQQLQHQHQTQAQTEDLMQGTPSDGGVRVYAHAHPHGSSHRPRPHPNPAHGDAHGEGYGRHGYGYGHTSGYDQSDASHSPLLTHRRIFQSHKSPTLSPSMAVSPLHSSHGRGRADATMATRYSARRETPSLATQAMSLSAPTSKHRKEVYEDAYAQVAKQWQLMDEVYDATMASFSAARSREHWRALHGEHPSADDSHDDGHRHHLQHQQQQQQRHRVSSTAAATRGHRYPRVTEILQGRKKRGPEALHAASDESVRSDLSAVRVRDHAVGYAISCLTEALTRSQPRCSSAEVALILNSLARARRTIERLVRRQEVAFTRLIAQQEEDVRRMKVMVNHEACR